MCDNCIGGKKERVDVTIAAQKFLSCVKRTQEKFGAHHIIDVLRGSEAKKIFKFGHQSLSTYGIGKEYSKKQWFQLSRQFLHSGLIIQDMEFGSFKLTERALDVLKGKEAVYGHLDQEETVDAPEVGAGDKEISDYDPKLFERLRKLRKQLADEIRVPPYVIFSDRSLIEMAMYFPQAKDRFLDIHGVGSMKYERYGSAFLDVIRTHCQEHQIEERIKRTRIRQKIKKVKDSVTLTKPRHHLVGEAYDSGESIESIMNRYEIKLVTVFDHFYKYLQEGFSLKPDEFLSFSSLSSDQNEQILDAFDELGTAYLRPVYDHFDASIDYEDLKVLRLFYLSRR